MAQTAPLLGEPTAAGPIDWRVAARTGQRLVRPGPDVSRTDADATVRRLRELAASAEEHVRDLTGLDDGQRPRRADVVDRQGWISSATDGLAALMPAEGAANGHSPTARRWAARSAGVQAGLGLAFLGSRVLGQYDPFGGSEDAPGRLVLVAPNVTAVHRALNVPADDFRMWVCLHETTHRLQFNAVPWLRDYFAEQVRTLLAGAQRTADATALLEALGRLPDVWRDARRDGVRDSLDLLMLLQAPEQRAVLDRLLALSTLLEGHAEYVMDSVGPSVVGSVGEIRRKFTARRHGGSVADRVLRVVLGLDAKLRQYAEGAAFTRHVVETVGMGGFNQVWTGPETLPARSEIADPAAWLRRMR